MQKSWLGARIKIQKHAKRLAWSQKFRKALELRGLAVQLLTEEALDLFKVLQTARVSPDVISYSSLITACKNGGVQGYASGSCEDGRFFLSYNALIAR